MSISHAELQNIRAWIHYLDALGSNAMSRIDDLAASLDRANSAVDRAVAEIADLKGKLDAASVEDPRLASLADQAAAIASKLEAVVPAPGSAEPAP